MHPEPFLLGVPEQTVPNANETPSSRVKVVTSRTGEMRVDIRTFGCFLAVTQFRNDNQQPVDDDEADE